MAKYQNVLIVDDDPLTLLICERLMKFAKFTEVVTSFSNGTEAFNYLLSKLSQETKEGMPEMILLDLNMLGMSGWDFLEKFNQLSHDKTELPSINVFSSSVSDQHKNKIMSYGFVKNYILKPLAVAHFETL